MMIMVMIVLGVILLLITIICMYIDLKYNISWLPAIGIITTGWGIIAIFIGLGIF